MPETKEEDHETETGHAEAAEAPRLEESQGEDDRRTEGTGRSAEPTEERPRPEGADKVNLPPDEEGDDEDDDFADDSDWQSFQQSQKQVG
jgi:hypothetical protein